MALQHTPFETLESGGSPGVRQISVFAENRCGQLLRLTQLMEEKDVKILSLSVADSADCAIVRLLTDDPDAAVDLLRNAGFALTVTEMVLVLLPPGRHGLLQVWKALLSGEVNIAYAYPLLSQKLGAAMVLSVDSAEMAMDILIAKKFEVLSEADLQDRF